MSSVFLSFFLFSCGVQSVSNIPSPVSVPVMDTSDLANISAMEDAIEVSAGDLDSKMTFLWTQHCIKQRQDSTRQEEYQKNAVVHTLIKNA